MERGDSDRGLAIFGPRMTRSVCFRQSSLASQLCDYSRARWPSIARKVAAYARGGPLRSRRTRAAAASTRMGWARTSESGKGLDSLDSDPSMAGGALVALIGKTRVPLAPSQQEPAGLARDGKSGCGSIDNNRSTMARGRDAGGLTLALG